jgi:hypothetical protein
LKILRESMSMFWLGSFIMVEDIKRINVNVLVGIKP